MLAIARHKEALATSLLSLARGEHGQLTSPVEPVAFARLIEEAWLPYAKKADARRLKVRLALEPANVAADPVLLRSILPNLFDNAADYTPEGGELVISVTAGEPVVVLRVANPAGSLTAADVAKLFDPFWRKEEARSGGQLVGLGRSLARTLAAAMSWTLAATLDEQHRLVFLLSGPPAG